MALQERERELINMAGIYDLTTTEVELLQAVAVLQQSGDLLLQSQLNAELLKFGAGYKAKPTFYSSSISSGTAEIERQAQISYAKIDTESLAATDSVDTINAVTGTTFNNGDLLICTIESVAREVVFSSGGNLNIKGGAFSANQEGAFIAFRYYGNSWYEQYRYPYREEDQFTLATEEVYISSGAATITKPYIRLYGELSGETLATGTITVNTATGTAGSIYAYSDEGSGQILLGSAVYSTATTATAQADALQKDIVANTGTHGYSASRIGTIVTVSAPTGTGATGNSYILSHTETGGLTATTVTFATLATGVTGSEADDTLATLNGGSDERLIIVENAMSSNTISLASGGNISFNGTPVINSGECVILLYNGTSWILFDPSGIITGSGISKTAVSSSPYTATDTTTPEQYYWVDTSGGAPITFNLAEISTLTTVNKVVIKDSGGAAATDNIVIVPGGSDTIDDDAIGYTINTDWNSITLVHDGGTNWEVV